MLPVLFIYNVTLVCCDVTSCEQKQNSFSTKKLGARWVLRLVSFRSRSNTKRLEHGKYCFFSLSLSVALFIGFWCCSLYKATFPHVPGHEIVGIVTALGSAVESPVEEKKTCFVLDGDCWKYLRKIYIVYICWLVSWLLDYNVARWRSRWHWRTVRRLLQRTNNIASRQQQ